MFYPVFPVAYGFARFEFPLKRFLFGLLMATMFLPAVVTRIPLYLLWKQLGFAIRFEAEDGAFVFIFVLEEFFVMFFYRYFYRKIVVKFMPEDDAQYSKWQLFVPKRIGIGWTFNFDCPLTYIILGGICIAMAAAAL